MPDKPLQEHEVKQLKVYLQMVSGKKKFSTAQANDFFDLSLRVGLKSRHLGVKIGASVIQTMAGLIKAASDRKERE